MDRFTRSKASIKAKKMVDHIGYPAELENFNVIEAFYNGLNLSDSDYLTNRFKLTKFIRNKSFSKLKNGVKKSDWETRANTAVVNAFYSPSENAMIFPAGILQGVFFSNDRPKYLNYGSLGWVIGHELIHGFDDQGRKFNPDGSLADWWDKSTAEK